MHFRGAGRVLVLAWSAGDQLRSGHETFGGALGFEKGGLSIVPGKEDSGQLGHLDRQAGRLLMNLPADLEQSERIEALAVFDEVLANSRQQRESQQVLIGRDGICD